MSDEQFWSSQSATTHPGDAGSAIGELPSDLASLREASSKLVFHYRADGDYEENGIGADRIHEINTRYAGDMFARLFDVGAPSLSTERSANERLVGCCRDATVLFLSLAREKGLAARARVGFSTYFHPGWFIDHVVAEVFDPEEKRWRLIDPEMNGAWTPVVDGREVDWLDLSPEQFVTGPRAWLLARAGQADPEKFVVAPDLEIPQTRGWLYLAHNLVHDLAALNKTEMLLWDNWGLLESDGDFADYLEDFDDLATQLVELDSPAPVREWSEKPEYAVSDVVTSFSPAHEQPLRVDVSRALVRFHYPYVTV